MRVRPEEALRIAGGITLADDIIDVFVLDQKLDKSKPAIASGLELVVDLKAPAHGPPFLALALDLQNTQSSNVSATVRGRVLLFDTVGRTRRRASISHSATRWRSEASCTRPIGRAGFFVEPRAFAYRRDVPVFQDETYIAEYREEHGGASLDAGFTTAYRFETRGKGIEPQPGIDF